MRAKPLSALCGVGTFLVILSANVMSVGAEPPKAAKKPVPAAVDTTALAQQLKSGEEAQIHSALDELRLGGPKAATAAPAVVEVLTRGLNEPLTKQAIETLGDLES